MFWGCVENITILWYSVYLYIIIRWEVEAYNILLNLVPYSRKFRQGIYFGGLAVLRAIRQYFHPPNILQYDVIVT